jgi:2,3-bisphosphoglycerate-independent phosphoglycerate mutase
VSARLRPVVLAVLDGFGVSEERAHNAVCLARTPVLDALEVRQPGARLAASGADVGLPPGQVGNSEAGHSTLGSGRVPNPALSRVDAAIAEGTLAANPVVREVIAKAKDFGGRLHLIGLVSDGGVHASLRHLLALIDVARKARVRVVVHALLDGHDAAPRTAPRYITELEARLAGGVGRIGTVSGRYWGMDREGRWERVQKVYRAVLAAEVQRIDSALRGIEQSYAIGRTDEFMEPFVVFDYPGVSPVDTAIHFNLRSGPARELTLALAAQKFEAFPRKNGRPPFAGRYACLTACGPSPDVPVAFPEPNSPNTFPEILARAGLRQFRCAEAEKFPAVTSFFNAGPEGIVEGEERRLIPSRCDASTYAKRPEMGAAAVADATQRAIRSGSYDFVLVNFANPDVVGHTGVLDAATGAIEAVDRAIGRIVDAVRDAGGALVVTGSHGNCEQMTDPETGRPHTGHTTNPVPLYYLNDADPGARIRHGGSLRDVAPTLLELLELPLPAEMTGRSLLVR